MQRWCSFIPSKKLATEFRWDKGKTADRIDYLGTQLNSIANCQRTVEIQLLSPAPLLGKDLGDPDEDVEGVCVDADGVVDGVEFGDTVAPVGMVLSPVEDHVWSMNFI